MMVPKSESNNNVTWRSSVDVGLVAEELDELGLERLESELRLIERRALAEDGLERGEDGNRELLVRHGRWIRRRSLGLGFILLLLSLDLSSRGNGNGSVLESSKSAEPASREALDLSLSLNDRIGSFSADIKFRYGKTDDYY
ncbi:hypothetical protein B296_00032851 [Ensete ventricosum]|uniref:Uncharacterized protein n=1 Tax=Ensete ventricosum TaxID=4639 RepID=A0A426X5T6_ENSVE|nr:hypothetical protein B296_00032851 [Ensete ventricosum]